MRAVWVPSTAPASTVTTVRGPSPSWATIRGTSSDQNMVKYGSSSLWAAGRFSQIWNSSRGLAASRSHSGNISEWTMPEPAVSHCTSPRPKRAVAPRESEWSISPLRT